MEGACCVIVVRPGRRRRRRRRDGGSSSRDRPILFRIPPAVRHAAPPPPPTRPPPPLARCEEVTLRPHVSHRLPPADQCAEHGPQEYRAGRRQRSYKEAIGSPPHTNDMEGGKGRGGGPTRSNQRECESRSDSRGRMTGGVVGEYEGEVTC